MAFTNTSAFPKVALAPLPIALPYKIKDPVPTRPNKIPVTILVRMRSFMIIADKIKTIIGVVTIITDADMGEVRLNPLKKVSILNATPKKAAAIIRGKSFKSIFCFGIKSQINQKSNVEPLTRSNIKP